MTRRTARRQFLQRLTGLVAIVTAAAAFVVLAAIPAEPGFGAEPGADPRPGKAVPWKAGVAKAVITPEKAVWLAGYGSKRAPDGKLHDLWMKALALEDERGRRAVLITSDFQGVPRSMSDPRVRAAENEVRPRTSSGDVHFLAQPLRPPAGG